MIKVVSKGMFNTSHGLAFVIEYSKPIKAGQEIMIDGEVYKIKRIFMQSTPSENELVTLFVDKE